MLCVIQMFVNVKGLQSFKNQSADKWSYCLLKERIDFELPEMSRQQFQSYFLLNLQTLRLEVLVEKTLFTANLTKNI